MQEDQNEVSRQQEWILDQVEAVYGRRSGLSETITDGGFRYIDAVAKHVAAEKPSIDFLEIGSFMGISMVAWATSFRRYSILGDLVSLDPYSPQPFSQTPPWQEDAIAFSSPPETMARAMRLYARCDLDVRIIRATAREALSTLLSATRRFDVIFIDGNLEGLNPLFDFAAASALVRSGSYIVLAATNWPDVSAIKQICDKNFVNIMETSVKACYKVN